LFDHFQGKTSLQELQHYTQPKYLDGCKIFINLLSARRLTIQNKVIASFGNPSLFDGLTENPQEILFLRQKNQHLLFLQKKIIHRGKTIGLDQTIFNLNEELPDFKEVLSHVAIQNEAISQGGFDAGQQKWLFPIRNLPLHLSVSDSLAQETPILREQIPFLAFSLGNILLLLISFQWIVVRPVKKLVEGYRSTLQKLHKSSQELEEALRLRDTFFTIISHDLKNPVGTQMNLLELLHKDASASACAPALTPLTSALKDSARQTYNLLMDLLTWSRVQQRSFTFNRTWIELSGLVQKIISSIDLHLREKQLNISTEIDAGLLLLGDPDMLSMILRNLLNNAIHFSYRGSQIHLRAHLENDHAVIEVQDYGKGIDEAKQKELFSIGRKSTPGTEGEEGTGLGLPISYEFVKLHQGRIEVQSQPGQGSLFRLIFPEAKRTQK